MLYDFLNTERTAILATVKQNVQSTQGSRMRSEALDEGYSAFYDELIGILERDDPFEVHPELGLHTAQSEKQGKEYLRLGYTVSEVVHGYGNVCQAITELAARLGIAITAREFLQLNLSLDTAIAEAITEYNQTKWRESATIESGHLDTLASELSSSSGSAAILIDHAGDGNLNKRREAGEALRMSLQRMVDSIDARLLEVRS